MFKTQRTNATGNNNMNNINKVNVSGNKVAIGTQQLDNTVSNKIVFNEFFNCPIQEFRKKKFYQYNRGDGTDNERVEEIAWSIAKLNTAFLIQPVCVDKETDIIIDGNHTGSAILMAVDKYNAEIESVPCMYVTIPKTLGTTSKQRVAKAVQMLNNSRKGWTLENYIINYLKEGYADYKRLQEMAEELGPFFKEGDKIRWRYLSSLAGTSQQQKLRDGTYKLDAKEKDRQTKLGREIIEVWTAAGQPNIGPWVEGFILGYYQLKEAMGKAFNKDRLIEKINKSIFDGTLSTKAWREKLGFLLTS